MDEFRPRWRGAQAVGALYAVSGGAFLLASLSAIGGATLMRTGVPSRTFLFIPLGALLMVSGVGLLVRRTWAWRLAVLVSLSGVAVIGIRLLARDEAAPLLPPLVTDILVTLALVWARPGKGGIRTERGAGRR